MTRKNNTRALVLVDIQNDFCPHGTLAVPDGDAIVPVINRIQGHFQTLIVTQDWHPVGHQSFASSHPGKQPFETIEFPYGTQVLWPDHCVQGTRGAELHEALELRNADVIIRKGFRPHIDSYSAFFENDRTTPTGLAGYLRERGISDLAFVGLAFDFCVRYSAEDAAKLGFGVTVIEDACRAIDLDGSLDATQKSFAALSVNVVSSHQLAQAA